MSDLLPIGTVVQIKTLETKIMISGYYMIDQDAREIRKYCGINADVGLSLEKKFLLFNDDSIQCVIQMGYTTDKYDAQRSVVSKLMG